MRTKPSLSGPSLCSPLSCSSFQAKTESCNAPWSRFLATLIAEQLAEVPTNVFEDRIQQRTLEQISDTPVPQVVVVLVEVFTHFSRNRVQQRFGELIFHTLAISLAVKRATFARCCLYPVGLLLICLRRTRNPFVGHTDAPKVRDQKLSSGLLLMFMATHLLQFTSQLLSNIACTL